MCRTKYLFRKTIIGYSCKMSLCAQFLRPSRLCAPVARGLSATAEAVSIPDEPLQVFRTLENNPANHTTDHLHRFYTIEPKVQQRLFATGGLPKKFANNCATFLECSLLVRSPAVDIISYLNQTDYTRPANKYVLYGKMGVGKTLTVAHLVHYGLATKKIIVHVPWVPYWFKTPKEVATSLTKEGYYDLPLDAATWLVHFKRQNEPLLAELNLVVSKEYEWSAREITKAGAPLTEMIDLGVSRVKYACDIIYALTEELKLASTAGKCNTLVLIDGFNAFYAEQSRIKDEEKKWLKPTYVSLTDAFLNITKWDWCNGAIVLTVDPVATMSKDYEKSPGLPRLMLGTEGFEHLDPFLPVKVDDYTPEEFESVMEYYKDRKWVRNITKEGQRELELLSARNPYTLMTRTTHI
ncbi:28S ribosomal protein S29, mitochondrial [Venturia canescens]|uniref:28S ribosomal protein S29, mitochondrial n=1 Tax=Venturia canescens TaxID=32260 RepID=UPI001C9C3268|nr:28S ribosomal protein S29, mitochondrial [Venturia canescens]